MHFYVSIYQRKVASQLEWTTLGWGKDNRTTRGHQPLKLQRTLSGELRKVIAGLPVARIEDIQSLRGVRLERVKLELVLRGAGKRRQVAGTFPLIVDPRWTTDRDRMSIAYHPLRQHEWCPLREDEPIESQVALYLEKAWGELDDEQVEALTTSGKDLLKTFSFDATPPSVLDLLPEKKKGIWDDLVVDPTREAKKKKESRRAEVLPKLATNQTLRALDGSLHLGLPRSPYREQLARLVGSKEKRSTIVVGPPGSGKSTVIARWVRDLADADDYPLHQNLDRIHDVWLLSGKRIIAGMMYLGDWEQRCLEIVEDARHKRTILWIEDLPAFGRIGQSKTSDRSLADFFRGPVSRGEITMIAECTPEQLRRLEDDAPSFAAQFARVNVHPSGPEETLRIVLHEARALEVAHDVAFTPDTYRTALELGNALYPSAALPGKVVNILRDLAQHHTRRPGRGLPIELKSATVARLLARKTGLPLMLLHRDDDLPPESVRQEFTRQVSGQPGAVDAVVDLVQRVRAGLVDADRPFAVYLFTGPTGTGKTELASCLASYLYGSAQRLIRLDMGELGGPDAVPRLIGDRWTPEGVLTRQIQAQPFSVVLLDEIEKAHPAVLNLLLQVFDEGRLTDASGALADFRRAVIIMTSNLGARTRATIGFGDDAAGAAADVARAVREHFPPELFNRIDRVVPFSPLSPATARTIAEKEIARLVSRRGLKERRVFVDVADSLVDVVVAEAFDPRDGARPVKRWVERVIGGALTEHIVRDKGAALRRYRVYRGPRGIDVRGDQAGEAEPVPGRSPAAPGAPKPSPAALLETLERRLEWLVLDDLPDQLRRIGHPGETDGPAADALGELRQRYQALVEDLAAIVERAAPGSRWSDDDVPSSRGAKVKAGTLRVHAQETEQPAGYEDLIASTARLMRQAARAGDLDDHHATVVLSRVGRPPWRGRPGDDDDELPHLASILAEAIRQGADDVIVQARDGALTTPEQSDEVQRLAVPLSELGVRSLFTRLSGVYVLDSLAHGTTLARLDVYPADRTPSELLGQRATAARAHLDALAAGHGDAADPEALDRIVAHLRVTVPGAPEPTVELEDYVGGQVLTGPLTEVLTQLVRIHACWEDPR